MPLQGGDVVVVERSVVGAVPYALYFLVSHVGVGWDFRFFRSGLMEVSVTNATTLI